MSVVQRLDVIFPGEQIALVDGIEDMAARFDTLPNQRPSTCGAFALSYLLPSLGHARHEGHDLAAEDYLAHLAGVVVEEWEIGPSEEVSARVRDGQMTEQEARARYPAIWYRYPVRASSDPARQGTSPAGIARAVARGSAGALASLPIAGRRPDGSVQLTPDRWDGLLRLLHTRLHAWRVHAILNYQSDQLLGPRSPQYGPELLRDPRAIDLIPRDDWAVGHFGGFAGLWQRPTGQWWLVLMDTYKERGFDGYQPQPGELVRQGLVREDGRGGGMLLVVPRAVLAPLAQAIGEVGLELGMWDNGSPPSEDWSWALGE